MSTNRWIGWPVTGLVEFIRSTPLLIQIYFLYFVFPEFGIVLPALTAGVLAIGVHYATYCSEVYRAGLENIPRGQWEASIALNLSRSEEHTSELQSLMRISYAGFCLKKKKPHNTIK